MQNLNMLNNTKALLFITAIAALIVVGLFLPSSTAFSYPQETPPADQPKPEEKPADQPKPEEKPADQPKPEEKPADQPKPEEKPADQPKPEEKPADQPKPEEKPADQPKPEEKPADQPKPEEKPADQPKPEEKPADQPKPEEKPADQPKPEEKPADQPKPEEKPADQPKPEEKPADQPKPEEKPADQPKPEEKPADQPKPEEKPADQPKPEEKPADQPKPEEKPADQPKPEEKPADQQKPEEKPADQPKPEEKPADQPKPEEKPADQPKPEEKPADQPKPEEKPADQPKPEEKPADQPKPEEKPADQPKPEEKPADQPKPEEKPADQPKPEEKPADQPKPEEKPADQPKPEEKPADQPKPEEKPADQPKPEEKPADQPKPEEKPADQPKPEEKPAEPQIPGESHPYVARNIADLERLQQKINELSQKVQSAVVNIRYGDSQGTGIIVSKDGYVLTAGHVLIEPNKELEIIFPDGKKVRGTSLGICKWADAGLAKITQEGEWPFVEMAAKDTVVANDWCFTMGHPLGYLEERPPVLRIGRILQIQPHLLQSDCTIVAGDSGGPLFDLQGKVIGINSRIQGGIELNFHVSINVFHDYMDRLKSGESWGDNGKAKGDEEIRKAFKDAVKKIALSVVRVKCNGNDVALGTIVGADGWILTKKSELSGTIECVFPDGKAYPARITGIDGDFDLAMLKIEAKDLPVIDWKPFDWFNKPEEVPVGHFIACPGTGGETPLVFGIVSVPGRKIPIFGGLMGVIMQSVENLEGAKITRVLDNSPAKAAGLRSDDLITHIDGVAMKNNVEVVSAVKQHRPGEDVKITYKRGTESKEIKLKLIASLAGNRDKRDMQNRMGVGLSKLRDGFPLVIQHDAPLRPADCGGPLVTLDGKVVGLNIARGGRVETYAIPTPELMTRLYKLMSGNEAPK